MKQQIPSPQWPAQSLVVGLLLFYGGPAVAFAFHSSMGWGLGALAVMAAFAFNAFYKGGHRRVERLLDGSLEIQQRAALGPIKTGLVAVPVSLQIAYLLGSSRHPSWIVVHAVTAEGKRHTVGDFYTRASAQAFARRLSEGWGLPVVDITRPSWIYFFAWFFWFLLTYLPSAFFLMVFLRA